MLRQPDITRLLCRPGRGGSRGEAQDSSQAQMVFFPPRAAGYPQLCWCVAERGVWDLQAPFARQEPAI